MTKFDAMILMKEGRIDFLKKELALSKDIIQRLAKEDFVDDLRIITEAKKVGDMQNEIAMVQEEIRMIKALQE